MLIKINLIQFKSLPLERYSKAVKMRYYKPMLREVSHFSKFYDFAIIDYFAIFANFAKSFGHFMGVDKIYPHAKFGVNISIQYRVMAQNRFQPYMAVRRPSWIGRPQKNNSAVHFEVLNVILQFQLNPSSGSLVIAGEMKSREFGPEHSTQSIARYASAAFFVNNFKFFQRWSVQWNLENSHNYPKHQ